MIFTEQLSLFPNHYPWTDEFIYAMIKNPWTPKEFDFEQDYHQFKTVLTDEERQVVTNTLSAIGQVEVAVKKFWARLGDNLPHPSIANLGIIMSQVEVIHQMAYVKLLEVLQLTHVFQDNLELDVIKGRIMYLKKHLDKVYTDDKKQYVYALILFTLFVENVSLFSQFYIVLWFNKERNLLKDTAQQVQYTKNEELLHAQAGVRLIHTIREEYPELFDEELEELVRRETLEAFEAESNLIDWMLGSFSEGTLTPTILKEFVKGRFNESLEQVGFDPVFETDKSILEQSYWMRVQILASHKVDFFNKKPTDYVKHNRVYDEDDIF